jgi:hypothetical protein
VNHAPRGLKEDRSVRDLSGWYANVRYQEGKLVADRYFTRNEAGNDVWAIAEDIVNKRAPASLAGLSINAFGTGKQTKQADGDVLTVESITAATSVDDVSTPAAGGGYALTASAGNDLLETVFQSLTFEEWFAMRPEFTGRLQNELKAVRQDTTVKAALAEADRVKAERDTERQRAETAERDRDAALVENDRKDRLIALEKVLRKAGLPLAWEESVRAQLSEAALDKWDGILKAEQVKAKAAGAGKVTVTGANAQTAAALKEAVKPNGTQPLNMDQFKSPEEFIAHLAQFRSNS